MHPIIAARTSPRAFDPTPLDATDVEALFEAARWAPSSRNEQPWRFLVASIDQPEAHARMVELLEASNARWAHRAPLLVVGATRTTFARDGRPNRHAMYDLGQAVAQLSLEAVSRGLFVHQMGGFHAELARDALALPADVEIGAVLAIGRRADPSALPEDLRERETAPRTRRPLAEITFGARWGEGWPTLGG